jgi:hypothetical protein|uniref:LysW biosynthesis protein LysW n=1 Tax=Siphoviridae sp. ctB9N2 TaxID=2826188 RepID=A0A8S5NGQ4_9CAUD|nr:MAG TPA: LysW biosynthesis protein LysW [Siphoviridae sp. ctB9N2]
MAIEYIDREKAKRLLHIEYAYAAEQLLDEIPTADVAPMVHGKWIVRFDGPYKRRRCYCSHCGKHNGVGGIAQNQEKPYCPNCGAKMDGGDNDETNGNV